MMTWSMSCSCRIGGVIVGFHLDGGASRSSRSSIGMAHQRISQHMYAYNKPNRLTTCMINQIVRRPLTLLPPVSIQSNLHGTSIASVFISFLATLAAACRNMTLMRCTLKLSPCGEVGFASLRPCGEVGGSGVCVVGRPAESETE